jgi:hypothetical protein
MYIMSFETPKTIDQDLSNKNKKNNLDIWNNIEKQNRQKFLNVFFEKIETVDFSEEYEKYQEFIKEINSWKDPKFTKELRNNFFWSLHYLNNWEITKDNIRWIIYEYIPVFIKALWWSFGWTRVELWWIKININKFSKNWQIEDKVFFLSSILNSIIKNSENKYNMEFENWYDLNKIKLNINNLWWRNDSVEIIEVKEDVNTYEENNLKLSDDEKINKLEQQQLELSKQNLQLKLSKLENEHNSLPDFQKKQIEEIELEINQLETNILLFQTEWAILNDDKVNINNFLKFKIFTTEVEINNKKNELWKINKNWWIREKKTITNEEWNIRYSFIWDEYIGSDEYKVEDQQLILKFTIMYFHR